MKTDKKLLPWEQLGKEWHQNPDYLEEEYAEIGITLKGKTIWVYANGENNKVTPKDVITYYRTDARNISSGYRTIADIGGDWRNIDQLAKTCLDIYKVISRRQLDREAKKQGLQLRR